jgi:cardiolipin synthase A/B
LKKKSTDDFLTHNHAKLIRGGAEYFTLLHKLIDEAHVSIHFQTYIFDPDETGTAVAEALVRASQRGVKVYMLVDGFGSQQMDDEFMSWLQNAGIYIRKFQAMFKSRRYYMGRRLHHKVVVIDSWKCTVAGLNISNRYNDMPDQPAWLDWALYAEGEIAQPLEELCKSRLRLRRRQFPEAPHHEKLRSHMIPLRVRVNDWFGRRRQIYKSYLNMFRDATSHVTIMSAYFLPGRLFRKKMEEAIRRGVKFKVVLTANADIFMIKYAERYIYRWLFKNGVEVFEYKPNVLHAKIAFCDGNWMTVGSFNVNNLSAFASIELNIEVSEPNFIQQQEARIEEIIQNECVKITEKKFDHQFNFISKFAQQVAYQVFRVLFFLSTKQKRDF